MIDNPLVSICVMSYNSSAFVVETLESAKTQTYKNIELIVSDDGSSDDTVELCRNWLSENKDRFVRTELITVEKNTGIPANCNRMVKAAKGKWIKIIAADDILLENCIADNVNHVNENPEIKIQFSKIQLFDVENGEKNFIDTWGESGRLFNSNAGEQFKNLLIGDFVILTPSSFILKQLIVDLNYFDEEFPLIEDYPFWLKCTRNGNKLYFMNKLTVLYRQHNEAVSITLRSADKDLIEPVSYRNQGFYEKYIYPYYKLIFKMGKRYEYRIKGLFKDSKSTNLNRFAFNLLSKYLNPFRYINYFFFRLNSNNEFWMLKESVNKS